MHFCFIFVIFAFQGVHSSHFPHHFLFHFLDHSDHSSAKHAKMSRKWPENVTVNNPMYAFIYRLYEPRNFADSSFIKTEFDEETTARYTINIAYPGGTKECRGFYSIYA
jgi:hypothetical protein